MTVTPILPPSDGGTFADVVDDVLERMHGLSTTRPGVGVLLAALSDTDETLTYDPTYPLGRGVVEVDDELLLIGSASAGTAGVLKRGWRGTVPAVHAAGSVMTLNPVVSRSHGFAVVRDALSAVYPAVFGVGSVDLTTDGAVAQPLPAGVESVLGVQQRFAGEWSKVSAWEKVADHPVSGNALLLPDLPSGTTVRVTVSLCPVVPSSTADTWSSTGLSLATRRLVVLHAVADLVPSIDLARLSDRASQARDDGRMIQPGVGMQLSRQFRAEYLAGLQQEAFVLRGRFPARVHRVR